MGEARHAREDGNVGVAHAEVGQVCLKLVQHPKLKKTITFCNADLEPDGGCPNEEAHLHD